MKVQINPSQKIVVVFGEVEYTMTKPKLGVALDLEEKLESAKKSGKGATRLVMEYIAKCGLPEDVIKDLDSDQLEAVMGALTPSKKN